MAKTNVNWNVANEEHKIRRSAFKIFGHAHTNLFTSSMSYGTVHKPGGGILGVNNRWTGRIFDTGSDSRGIKRWAYASLSGKGNKKVTFISAYRVCQQADPGPKTVSMQEHLLLCEQLDKQIINPRQQFLDDLADFVGMKIGEGHEIILMLDANKDLDESGPWKEFNERCNLYDLMERQKDDNPIPASQEGSTRRIDYIVGTSTVYQATISAGVDQINS